MLEFEHRRKKNRCTVAKKEKSFFKIIFHSKLISDSLKNNQNFKELFLFD